ncbi:MAG: hypothetical protein IJ524_04645 [Bacteroidales bacterium]|nr:hypothetical protein [Bacteroidales bacterium]
MLLGALLATGCRQHTDDTPLLASVYGHELHSSDLAGLVGEGVSAEDSTAIVASYVEQWIRQTVLLAKAEKNITDDFDRQLNEYRNSLLIYAYEQKIVNQLLDTNISDEQIADYYEQHRDDFHLKNAIVKAVYVTAPDKSPAVAKLKKIIERKGFDDHDVVELEELSSRNNLTGYYDIDSWIPFYTLQKAVPITTYNEDIYLKQNRTITLSDNGLTYLVRILDYKVSDETSPLELQTENIRSILLNHRKLEILNRLQSDLLKEAEKNDNVKRYI